MNNKETKKDSSVFELNEIRYGECGFYDDDNPPQYPSFEVNRLQIGLFTSFAKAEQGMKKYVKENIENSKKRGHEWLQCIFGFLIFEYPLDNLDNVTYFDCKSARNYLPDGSLLDECLVSNVPDEEGDFEEFLGRPVEKVRYCNGELVEELYGRDTVRLAIIGNPPFSPEKINEYKTKYWNKSGFHQDSTDDTYYAIGDVGDDDDDYIHSHPSPINLFPLRFPVSDELRKNLEKAYRQYRADFD